MKASQKLRKNGRKGFTLVELIIVIVIIAILIAALTPAIMGVIQRANKAADEADLRTVMLAAQTAADYNSTVPPSNTLISGAMTAGNLPPITCTLYFKGSFCVGARLITGRTTDAPTTIFIGDTTPPATDQQVWPGTTTPDP